ncbi:hypothetical protein K505DRAFT_344368 [Melanomma pulvis-pyrius CBS 109.77]|uniref:Uncharacterized protein n=1 Tax=Melanomma pulvis-pyrius CBS 109.77 TaxID=1314802 RepID=A0A6A6WNV7_9PLEO|nr:hypothetical protein K505DRAFT_344368 [Melanomma pulvis-pyrius CBS 109.77]
MARNNYISSSREGIANSSINDPPNDPIDSTQFCRAQPSKSTHAMPYGSSLADDEIQGDNFGIKENIGNQHVPTALQSAAEFAPKPKLKGPHTHSSWSAKEETILAKATESRMSWEETMELLPNKTQMAASDRVRLLKKTGVLRIPAGQQRFRESNFKHTNPGVIHDILKDAEDAQDAADLEKEASQANINKLRAEAEAAARRAPTKVPVHWSHEDDLYLLREWFNMRDEGDIAKGLPGKSVKMCRERRIYLTKGDKTDGSCKPTPVYLQVLLEQSAKK